MGESPKKPNDDNEYQPHLRAVPGSRDSAGRSRDHLDSVKDGETSAATPVPTKAEKAEAKEIKENIEENSGGGSGRRSIRSYVTKKRAAVTGGIFGVIFGAFGVGSFLRGPAEFMHLTNFLKNTHLSIPDSFSDDISGRFVVYALAGKSAEGRMGAYGNHRANKWESRLEKNGLKSMYQVGTQRGIGFQVTDPIKAEPFLREMRARGIPIDSTFSNAIDINRNRAVDGVKGVDTSSLSFRDRNTVTRAATRSIKINRVSSWLGSRLLIRRSGTDGMFHPFRNRFRRYVDNIAIERQKKQDAKEEERNRHTTGDADTDVGDTRLGRLRSKFSQMLRTAKGPAIAVATVCSAKGFSESIDAQNQENQLTMIRMAATALGRGDQTKAFSVSYADLTMGEYALASENLYDPETDTSWVGDFGVQKEMNGKATGPDLLAENDLKPTSEKPQVFELLGGIPTGFGAVDLCDAITAAGDITSNIPGVGFALDKFNALVDAAVATVSGKSIDDWLQVLRDRYATSVANSDAQGALYGGIVNMGGRLFASQQMQMAGGRPLSETEERNLKIAAAEERRFLLAQQSFSERHLDIMNIESTAGKLAFSMPKSRGEITTTIAKLPSSIVGVFTRPFTKNADAQTSTTGYDYGFKAMGFSQNELDDERFENPFEIGQYYIDNPEELEEMNNEYGEDCYAMKISEEGDLQYETVGEEDSLTEVPEKCSKTVLGASTDGIDSQVLAAQEAKLLRYRFHIAYTVTSHALDCYEGFSEDSCDQIYGKGIASEQDGGGPTGPIDPATGCPTGSTNKDIVVVQGVDMHKCIAKQMDQLFNDARAERIDLVTGTGGWRNPQEQIELRRQHCGTSNFALYEMPSGQCSPPTARPGSSNHESGTAIDFACNGGGSVSRGNACWNWLEANAGKYGLINLPSEAWHWSIDGT